MATVDERAPRVSVGMAVYNGEPFLPFTIDSLLTQTYRDIELVICDNCSTDRTQQICEDYAARDPRVRYYRNPTNIGVARNYNRAFSLSRGEYFKYASADDYYAPSLIEKCVAMLDRRPDAVLCYPKTQLVDDRNEPIGVYEDKLDLQQPLPHKRLSHLLWNMVLCNAVYGLQRASVRRQVRPYAPYPSSDTVFLAELALFGTFVELPERLFFRRMFERSMEKYPSPYERMKIYDPGNNSRWLFPNWTLFFDHLVAIHRAPLSLRERLLCYSKMHIWLRRWGDKLWPDLTYPFLHYNPNSARLEPTS